MSGADYDNNQLQMLGLDSQKRRFEKLGLLKKKPLATAVVSKLVRNNEHLGNSNNVNPSRGVDIPTTGYLNKVSDITAGNVTDAENLYQMLPDTELAEQILVSSILSPKDMVTTELNYVCNESSLKGEITGVLLSVVEDFFTKVYKIDPQLPTILSDVLFKKGSYPVMIIPESSVDEIINGERGAVGMESRSDTKGLFTHSIGVLGDSTFEDGKLLPKTRLKVSMESLNLYSTPSYRMLRPRLAKKGFDTKISVSDNPDLLKAPFVHSLQRQHQLAAAFKRQGFGMESQNEVSRDDIEMSFYRPRMQAARPVVGLKTAGQVKRATVGHPLVMRLPSESIIPVHVPGSPNEHIGYFVILDPMGNPVVKANRSEYYNDLNMNMSINKDMASQLISQGQRTVEGYQQRSDIDTEEATRIYAQLVEEDLIARLRNGIYADNIEISRPLEVYRIMLARTFANMSTQLLFVPAELVTYFAFDYNRYGVGKSLLEDNKILASLRVMMMLSNTMSAIKNSTPHTGLNITLDPNDPDPSGTVEKLVHNYTQTRQASYPLGASSPVDIVNFLQNAGVDLNVQGSPAYPETRMEVEDRQRSVVAPNTDLEDNLKKQYLMSLGLSPETVDSGYNVEFATSIVTSNLLLTKRVMLYQDLFTALLGEFIRKYVLNSGNLMDKLRKTVEANKNMLQDVDGTKQKAQLAEGGQKPTEAESDSNEAVDVDAIVAEFINSLGVSLPRPDSITLERQMEAYDKYIEGLEKCLEAYFNADFLEGTSLGDQSESVEVVKAAILAHFKRKWMRDNNVMPELAELVTFTEDEHPMIDLLNTHTEHVNAIGASIQGYMIKVAETIKARNELTEAVETDKDIDIGGSVVEGSTDDSGGDDGMGGDDDMGGDDFGDDDMGGDDLGGDDLDAEGDAEGEGEGTDEEAPADDAEAEEEEPVEEEEVSEEANGDATGGGALAEFLERSKRARKDNHV
jgi:hypothetical protein